MNILFIDVETTGLDANKHTMIELAARLDSDGKTIDKFHAKFFNSKNVHIDLGALKVNKVALKELMVAKPEIEEIARLVDWLLELTTKVKGQIYVSGQNVQFDVNFLKNTLAKYNVEGLDQIIGYKYIDTFSLAMGLINAGKLITENNKLNLENIAKSLNIDLTNKQLHTAEADVDIAAEVFYGLVKLIRG